MLGRFALDSTSSLEDITAMPFDAKEAMMMELLKMLNLLTI